MGQWLSARSSLALPAPLKHDWVITLLQSQNALQALLLAVSSSSSGNICNFCVHKKANGIALAGHAKNAVPVYAKQRSSRLLGQYVHITLVHAERKQKNNYALYILSQKSNFHSNMLHCLICEIITISNNQPCSIIQNIQLFCLFMMVQLIWIVNQIELLLNTVTSTFTIT